MREGARDRAVETSVHEIGLLRQLGEELGRVASPVELMQNALPICLALVACSSLELTLSEASEPAVLLKGSIGSGPDPDVTLSHPSVMEPSPLTAGDSLSVGVPGPGGELVRLVAYGVSNKATARDRLDLAAHLVAGALWRVTKQFDRSTFLSDRSVMYHEGPGRIEQATRQGRTSALFLIDLDNFKQVNDTLGHQAGDAVLSEIGRRLRAAAVPDTHIAVRIGGDEFAILATDLHSPDASEVLAHKLLEALEPAMTIDDVVLQVDASLGIAVHDIDGSSLEHLLREADKAMYAAKALGSRNWQRSTPRAGRLHGSAETVSTEEIRRALAGRELLMYYQPQVAAATGEVVGLEALVRWEHPRHGLLLARDFVHVAESSGLMSSLNSIVLELGLADYGRIHRIAPTASLSLNVSARSLLGEGLVQELRQALERHQVPASRLTIEITEPASDYSRSTMHVLGSLEELGCSVSVHEFGRGRTSLSVLSRYPVIREIKVDPGLVRAVISEPEAARMVRAIVEMAHALDVRVVAEGVDSPTVATALRGLGCDALQGFYIREAVSLDELEKWVTASPRFQV
jgi:diguanylate cyclase